MNTPSTTSSSSVDGDPAAGAPPHGSLPAALVEAFMAFLPAFGRWIEAGPRGGGPGMARSRLLHQLHCDGPLKMRDLGSRLGVTARNVTVLVDGLEAESLVRRTPHPTDRRITLIELTEEGTREGDTFYAGHAGRAMEVFAVLPEVDQRHLLATIGTLRNEVARRAGRP